jgi:hypothetical protein
MSTRAKLLVLVIAAATFQLTGNEAKPQPNCDVVKVAEGYVRTHLSFISTANRRWSSSIESNVWTVRLELPEGALGFVPEIGVDQRSCQVVSAKVWQ